jgi:hypothetical protein
MDSCVFSSSFPSFWNPHHFDLARGSESQHQPWILRTIKLPVVPVPSACLHLSIWREVCVERPSIPSPVTTLVLDRDSWLFSTLNFTVYSERSDHSMIKRRKKNRSVRFQSTVSSRVCKVAKELT